MRTEELYYLVDLTKTKSINRTAERFHISQPAISKSLNKLEDELGVKLFFRSHRGVYLTEAGELVVEMAEEILTTIDKYKAKLNVYLDESSSVSEKLTINAVPAISNGILLDILVGFCKTFPNFNVTVKDQEVPDILNNIKAGHADLGIIRIVEGLVEIDENEFFMEKLFHDKLVVCTKKSSLLSNRESISIKELVKYPLIIYYSDTFIKHFLKKKDKAKVTLNSNNFSIFKKTVIEGVAAGIITEYMAASALEKEFDSKEIIMIPVTDNIKISYGWVRSKKHPFTTIAQEFVEMLKSRCYF